MPHTSDSAMPRSPRYSRAHVLKANTCESRSRGPTAWHACRYSCAIVPSGVRPSSIANFTLLVPTNFGPMPERERAQHLAVPGAGEAPPRPVVGDAEFGVGDRVHLVDLLREALRRPSAKSACGCVLRSKTSDTIASTGHLEQDRVQPGPADRDVDFAVRSGDRLDPDESLVELEEAEEIDEIALEEAPAAQVGELVGREAQAAKAANLVADFRDIRRQVDARDCGT